jgi:hypothetical protein
MRLCVCLRSARQIAIANNTMTIRTFLFSPLLSAQAHACTANYKHTHARRSLASSFSTRPPGDRGALHCHWNAIATQPIGLVPFQARGILPVAEEQSRTRGGQSGGITKINLNVEGCGLVAAPMHAPSRAQKRWEPLGLTDAVTGGACEVDRTWLSASVR